MFDLEQSIAEGRNQMLAAGIKALVPLEELENHLREEIERQIKSGLDAQQAFENSARTIGRATDLKSEFRKIHDSRASNRILALFWFAGCLWSFDTTCRQFGSAQFVAGGQLFLMNSLVAFVYAAGVFGSFLLFRGSKLGSSIIRTIALLLLIAFIAQCLPNFNAPAKWRMWCGVCAIFSVISIWRLHLPQNLKSGA
jgi:hypothetical protein